MSVIPVKNIYYMILYAFDKVKNKSLISSKDFEKFETASDVIISLFLDEVSKIVKKGIYKSYTGIVEESIFIKGKVKIKESLRRVGAKKVISHDEFNISNDVNIIIKYTLNKMLFSDMDKKHVKKARLLYPYFLETEYRAITDFDYKSILLNKSNLGYDFALQLSVFINRKVIPDKKLGKLKFVNIFEDEETMSMIYEEFLRKFYRIHTTYKVVSKEYDWYLTPLGESDQSLLPKMRTDIELVIDDETKIIIDAKYYKKALASRYETNKFFSNNMYQMNTYLSHNLEYKNLRGILLYPAVDYEIREMFVKKGSYTIEFQTVNLNGDWKDIEKELLVIIKE